MEFNNKKIGIWGFGIVGKAALCYMRKYNAQITVMDCRTLHSDELHFLEQHNTSFCHEKYLENFFGQNDYVLASPGINHPACKQYKHKIISELDLFCDAYKKPIISVTGSVGKTTIVHLLSQLLEKSIKIATGGNIGTAMLDLIDKQSDTTLLELSSFQLEQCQSFAPDLAIWTNFHANHLDWHGSQETYFSAKQNIIRNQRTGQKALIPLNLIEKLLPLHKHGIDWYFFSVEPPLPQQQKLLKPVAQGIFYVQKDSIVFEQNNIIKPLIKLSNLPPITFIENWLVISATLYLSHIPLAVITTTDTRLSIPEHRLKKIASINEVDIYNDSKATTPAATLAAVIHLQKHPIILLIGGISKGIDRTALIKHLNNSVKMIVCFGCERQQLADLCHRYNKQCQSFHTLDKAFLFCTQIAQPTDQILFSPAGASFDQFIDYKERGTYFKKLVQKYSNELHTPLLRNTE